MKETEKENEYREYEYRGERRIGQPPKTTEELLRVVIDYYSTFLATLEMIPEEKGGERGKEVVGILRDILQEWEEAEEDYLSSDTPEPRKREIRYQTEEWVSNLILLFSLNPEGLVGGNIKYPPYRIKIDPETGERSKVEDSNWGDLLFPPGELSPGESRPPTSALRELKKLSKLSPLPRINISKDLVDTQTHSAGNPLEYISDQELKRKIQEKQKEGKLLAGTLEGLSGGNAYFMAFTIALAQILNEQSRYYGSKEDTTGVPVSLLPEIFGEAELDYDSRKTEITTKGKKELRRYPLIIISYEALAKKLKGEGKTPGGQDIKYIQNYIKELSGKEYLLDVGEDTLLGIPFLRKVTSIYRKRNGKEVGCLLQLSPQFSRSLRGYTSLRGDTIQLIGGARQKDITMALLNRLAYVRGVNSGSIWRKNKEDLLADIATSKRYIKQKGERERDFRGAIQKVKDCGLILDYWEEGLVSVFKFNPDYLKGEISGPAPEDQ